MDDLIAFVRAQLDEDERVAGDAAADSPTPWRDETRRSEDGYHGGKIRSSAGYAVVHIEDQTPQPEVVAHIARWDPARVLAEVEAKRRIVDRWETAIWDERAALSWVVEQLAQPYAGRPGWREEWAA